MSLTEDFKTLVEVESNLRQVMNQVHKTGRPIVVTVNGRPDMVILDAATYEQQLKLRNLAQLLAEAEADRRAGRRQPAEDVEAEFFRAKKIPR